MKKVIGFLIIAVIVGCKCTLGQLPTQYVYVDSLCQATLPDYTTAVTASDNCDGPISISQNPSAGTIVSSTTVVMLRATDASGNQSSSTFQVMVLDTIAPVMYFADSLTAYNWDDIRHIYGTFSNFVMRNIEEFVNEFDWEAWEYGPDPITCWTNTLCLEDFQFGEPF